MYEIAERAPEDTRIQEVKKPEEFLVRTKLLLKKFEEKLTESLQRGWGMLVNEISFWFSNGLLT